MMVEQSDERDALRARLAGMWGAVAGGWAQHADYADARGAQSAERMLELARRGRRRPRARARLRAGRAGARGGRARRARRRGRAHRRRRGDDRDRRRARRRAGPGATSAPACLDLERIDEPDGSYDVVLCREGLMFALEPGRARRRDPRACCAPAAASRSPSGRPRERNPWLGLVMDAVSAQIGAPVPPPGIPGPFALGDAGELRGLLDRRRPGRRAGRTSCRCRCGPRRSTSGGRGRRRSPARCRRSSRRCPRRACRRCASAPARPCAPTRPRRAGSTSRA